MQTRSCEALVARADVEFFKRVGQDAGVVLLQRIELSLSEAAAAGIWDLFGCFGHLYGLYGTGRQGVYPNKLVFRGEGIGRSRQDGFWERALTVWATPPGAHLETRCRRMSG